MTSTPTSRAARDLTRRVVHVMGMPVSLALAGRHAGTAAGDEAWADAVASLQEADAVFSTYRPDSAVSRLNRGELALRDCPGLVSEVLELAETARQDSGGAFDVRRPDGTLDPSGIVKGWAVDRAVGVLCRLEDTDFCLSAGGDLVCVTVRPQAPAWRIGIEDPRDPHSVLAVVSVRNGAVATSGFAHRGAHIDDPRTGETPRSFASVTVIASTLTAADVDATTAFVLGPEAPAWIDGRPGRAALFVDADGRLTRAGLAQL